MMEYDSIDVSEDITTTKIGGECIICHHQYFTGLDFQFQPKVCDDCHNMTQKYMSFNDVAIVNIRRNDYMIDFWSINKSEAVR